MNKEKNENDGLKIAVFDFDDAVYLVAYRSDNDISYKIGEAIQEYVENNDIQSYKKAIDEVMSQFNVEYEIANPNNVYRV